MGKKPKLTLTTQKKKKIRPGLRTVAAAGAKLLDAGLKLSPKTAAIATTLAEMGVSAESILKRLTSIWDASTGRRADLVASGLDLDAEDPEVSAPVTLATTIGDMTKWKISEISDPSHGDGIRLCGSQLATFIVQNVTGVPNNSTAFSLSGTWSNGGSPSVQGELHVSPLMMGGRVAQMAGLYAKFRVNRLIFAYMPVVGTSSSRSFVLGYGADSDNGLGTAGTAFAECTQMQSAKAIPVWLPTTWEPALTNEVRYVATSWGTIEGDQALRKLTTDGDIYGRFDTATSAAGSNVGTLMVAYEIELFSQTFPRSITFDPILNHLATGIYNALGDGGSKLPFRICAAHDWDVELDISKDAPQIVLKCSHVASSSSDAPDFDDWDSKPTVVPPPATPPRKYK